MARYIEEVCRVHAHLCPHAPILQRLAPSRSLHVVDEVAHRALAEVERVALLLQRREDSLRIHVGPIREQHHVVALGAVSLTVPRLDHYWPIEPCLLLEPRMRVVPVGAVLV